MIKIEKINVYGFEPAIRGMRNPLNSWDKSDSEYDSYGQFLVGEDDLKLMQKLVKAGPEHAKFLRMITITMDITAPLYWWKEFDTYKIATVANSCSTMHTLHKKVLMLDDFSCEHLRGTERGILQATIDMINREMAKYKIDNDRETWYQMIQLLPSSFNQKRTVQFNYQTAANMYYQRRNHKLDEWLTFCGIIRNLYLFEELFVYQGKETTNEI